MAAVADVTSTRRTSDLGVARFALTGGIAAAILFGLCWLGSRLDFGSATHRYLTLFTDADVASGAALVEGVYWSVAFGLIAGALIALVYNMLAFLDPP